MAVSTNQRKELGNGLCIGGTPYSDEICFGDLSDSERLSYVQTAEDTIEELTAHKGIFFERYFGKHKGTFLVFLTKVAYVLLIVMAIPLLFSIRQILEGVEFMGLSDWMRFGLVSVGFVLNAVSLTIASSSVHTQNYWSEFLELIQEPDIRNQLIFCPDRPAPKHHHLSGWLQTWGILTWVLGVMFWTA